MWMSEAQKRAIASLRGAMDKAVVAISATATAKEVNDVSPLIRPWKPWVYSEGDVRMYEGAPYKCVQTHDSTDNPDWNPTVASLWMQYHGTSRETARPYVRPTGAHDMYKAGEWVIFTDSAVYEAISDTAYSPSEYPAAWRKDEGE